MKKILLTASAILVALFSFAQGGWPAGEKEVRIFLHSVADAAVLNSLRLVTEAAEPGGIVLESWVNPAEYEKLKKSGLEYQVIIPDMTEYYSRYRETQVPPGYHTYEEIVALADSLAENFPQICKKVMFGTSIGGRQLAALKISDSVNYDSSEPEILFDGGIHGDEIGGPENLIRYARELCLGYGSNPEYTNLIDTREIWIYYMVNPDGRVNMSRFNNDTVDCNRDFGYMWNELGGSTSPFSQPETKALRNCIFDNQFVIYFNYHSGAQVLIYPWNYRQSSSPDNTPFSYLANLYSTTSGYPNLPYGQAYTAMYPVNGCAMDSKYGSLGNISYTMELSSDKQPPAPQMIMLYEYNVPAMTEMIKRCGNGLTGRITDSVTGKVVKASVWVNDYYPVYNDPVIGDYHKYLLQGYFNVKVVANGYKTKTLTNVGIPLQGVTQRDFQLVPDSLRYAYRVISCYIPDNNFQDEGYTPGALGAPDGIAYSLGSNGFIVLDMGDTIFNGPGNDITVYEAGSTPEGFYCYGGITMDGPWVSLGYGSGTTSFELGYGSLQKVRYLKILDDGIGPSLGSDAGFDLDAVQMLTPPLVPDFSVNDTAPCINAPINFTSLSSGNPTLYIWQFPGGTPSSSTDVNPSGIYYAAPGNYNVTLTISNGFSSSTITKTAYIHVASAPEKPGLPSGPTNACNLSPALYTVDRVPFAESYTWNLSPANAGTINGSDTAGSVSWNNAFTGNAYIKVKGTGVCGEGQYSDSLEVTVRQSPVVFLGNDTSIHVSETLMLDAGNPGSAYLWSTGETTETIIVDSTGPGYGPKTVWVNVTNIEGCVSSDSITILFTPETGIISQSDETELFIFPNPASGKISVRVSNCRGDPYRITDISGKVVMTERVPADDHFDIDLSGLPGGIYFFRIFGDSKILVKKIMLH